MASKTDTSSKNIYELAGRIDDIIRREKLTNSEKVKLLNILTKGLGLSNHNLVSTFTQVGTVSCTQARTKATGPKTGPVSPYANDPVIRDLGVKLHKIQAKHPDVEQRTDEINKSIREIRQAVKARKDLLNPDRRSLEGGQP